MKLTVKDMDIATGGIHVAIINEEDAQALDLHHMDRLIVSKGKKKTVATVDIAESEKAVPQGSIGLFEEILAALSVKHGEKVTISFAKKPESVAYIRKKMDGHELMPNEIHSIMKDITDDKLTEVELTSFIVASYTRGMSKQEIVSMTKSMAETGDRLKIKQHPVVDLHSIGGVPGNRTTMLIVPILVAAGCIVPKTSSRAITSPAGTADTMEVLCSVRIGMKKLEKIIKKVGGFIIWGGAVNLAPADDKIIQVEHPLNIDAEAQMVASIIAKKASVGATHLLLELPVGKGAKLSSRKEAKHLAKHFIEIGEKMGMKVLNVVMDGTKPVGKGIGPALEARDVIWALQGDKRAPKDLINKSVKLAGMLLEFVGKAKKGKGKRIARKIIREGEALKAMTKIVKAQGGEMPDPDNMKAGKKTRTFKAVKAGVFKVDNKVIAKAARLAGAPVNKECGLYFHEYCGKKVKRGQKLITIHAHSKRKLDYAVKEFQKNEAITIN